MPGYITSSHHIYNLCQFVSLPQCFITCVNVAHYRFIEFIAIATNCPLHTKSLAILGSGSVEGGKLLLAAGCRPSRQLTRPPRTVWLFKNRRERQRRHAKLQEAGLNLIQESRSCLRCDQRPRCGMTRRHHPDTLPQQGPGPKESRNSKLRIIAII